jgi:hypothetical protein
LGQPLIAYIGVNRNEIVKEKPGYHPILYEVIRKVNRRSVDTMIKGKWTKGQIMQNTTQKTKDRATLTPLKTGGELRCSGRVSSSSGTRRFNMCTDINVVTKQGYMYQHITSKRLEIITDLPFLLGMNCMVNCTLAFNMIVL